MRKVYGTQGGGLAKKINGTYIFIEVPKWAGDSIKVGDEVPAMWGIQGPFDQDTMKQLDDDSQDDE